MSKPTGQLAYRFEYADKSAFEIYDDGQAFITFPEVYRRAPEEKFGKITNNIRLLMGAVAKPRQDEIKRLREALILAENVLSRAPFSTELWPNGMHPQSGIDKIRKALNIKY